jgi:hypothetical protein
MSVMRSKKTIRQLFFPAFSFIGLIILHNLFDKIREVAYIFVFFVQMYVSIKVCQQQKVPFQEALKP